MDRLHDVLRAMQPQTKSTPDHLSVFREFLAHLDELQRQALSTKAPMRRKVARRGK